MDNNFPNAVPPVEEKKSNRTLIIIIAVVAVLCCCCVVFGALAWTFGDSILRELGLAARTLLA